MTNYVVSRQDKSIFSLEELFRTSGDGTSHLNILLLADTDHPANCVREHIRSIATSTRHNVVVRSPIDPRRRIHRLLKPKPKILLQTAAGRTFDVIIIHYSLCILYKYYIPEYLRKLLREFKGIKIQIIQDEYRNINSMMENISDIGINGVLSSLAPHNIQKVYRLAAMDGILLVSTLPGYLPEKQFSGDIPPIKQRKTHLVYRGRELPYWLGNAAREKTTLVKKLIPKLDGQNLQLDMSSKECDRIYGDGWLHFLRMGKATLGLEGGSSIFDFEGTIENSVKDYLKCKPDASYEEIHKKFLSQHEGNIVHRTITPRIFEAIRMKTAQVLFPGEYRGVLRPWDHYIPLERDFSNLNKVCGYLQDDVFLQRLVDNAFNDIVETGKYNGSNLGRAIDALIDLLGARFNSKIA